MLEASLDKIRNVRRWLEDWLQTVHKDPDPASRRPDDLRIISRKLSEVDLALKQAPSSVVESEEWNREVSEYAEALRELRARLGNFDIMLRIRLANVSNSRARLEAINSWADLAKHIG